MIGAIDIGGTKIAVGIVAENGRLITHQTTPTDPQAGVDAGLARITTMLKSAADQAGVSLTGIGIGCTGRHNVHKGILGNVEAFLPGWENAPIAHHLGQRFGVPVVLENDADAAALGEYAFGTGQGVDRFIYLTVSTGIGGGLVFNGDLYRGVEGAHPEIGHHVIERDGPLCFCGARGCWESLASGPALARWWLENHPASAEEVVAQDARHIANRAREGDAHAQAAISREAHYLGIGLANLITLFAPDRIALGGGVMQSWDLFAEETRVVIAQNCGLVPHHKVKISPVALGSEVVLVGTAVAWQLRYGK